MEVAAKSFTNEVLKYSDEIIGVNGSLPNPHMSSVLSNYLDIPQLQHPLQLRDLVWPLVKFVAGAEANTLAIAAYHLGKGRNEKIQIGNWQSEEKPHVKDFPLPIKGRPRPEEPKKNNARYPQPTLRRYRYYRNSTASLSPNTNATTDMHDPNKRQDLEISAKQKEILRPQFRVWKRKCGRLQRI